MDINAPNEKDESKEKLILMEAELSKSIISFMWFFSTNSIVKNTGLDKKTVNSHKETGIPPKYFELYIKALGGTNYPSPEMQKILKSKPHAIEKCKTLTQIIYNTLNCQYEEYRRLVGVAPYIFDRVLGKGTAHNKDVLEMLSKQLEKNIDFIYGRITQNEIENLSPQFLHRLNICFDAFSTMTKIDTLFFPTFFRASSERKEEILSQMNEMELNPVANIVSYLTSGSGKLWMTAYTHYSQDEKGRKAPGDTWKKLKEKIEGKFYQMKSIEEQKNALAFYSFLALIWPEKGETDTTFGLEEIKALIVFKYFLTEEAQRNLLDELQIDYT